MTVMIKNTVDKNTGEESLETFEFTSEAIEEFKSIFSLFDKCGDNHIPKTALKTVMLKLKENTINDQLNEWIEKNVDPKKTGKISFQEFLAIVDESRNLEDEALEAMEMLKAFDPDSVSTWKRVFIFILFIGIFFGLHLAVKNGSKVPKEL